MQFASISSSPKFLKWQAPSKRKPLIWINIDSQMKLPSRDILDARRLALFAREKPNDEPIQIEDFTIPQGLMTRAARIGIMEANDLEKRRVAKACRVEESPMEYFLR